MRRRDKLRNIERANLLAEQRYLQSKGLLKEGRDLGLMGCGDCGEKWEVGSTKNDDLCPYCRSHNVKGLDEGAVKEDSLKEDWEEDVYGQDYDPQDPGGYEPNKSNNNVMSSDRLYLGSDIKIVSDVEFVFNTQKGEQSINLGKIQLPNNTEYDFTPWEYDEGEIDFESDALYNQIKDNLPPNTDGYFKSFLHNYESMEILKDKDSGFFNQKDVPEEKDFDYRSRN